VLTQFFHHPLPDDWMLGGVMENVNLPKAQEDFAAGVATQPHVRRRRA